MPFSLPGFAIAILSFAVTYLVARTLAKWWKVRAAKRTNEETPEGESRQVRRARERGKSPR